MELAEQRRARYVVLADRVARLYAPVVHGCWPWSTFLGWLAPRRPGLAAGPADRHRGPDHHLPLRPGPGGAGGPGDRQRPPDAQRHPAEVGLDGAGTPGAGRHHRLRQDRHPDPGPAEPDPTRTARRRGPGLRPAWPRPAAIRWPARCAPLRAAPAGRRTVEEHPGCGPRCWRPGRASSAWAAGAGAASETGETRDGRTGGLWLAGRDRDPLRFAFIRPAALDAAEVVAALRRGLRDRTAVRRPQRHASPRLPEALGIEPGAPPARRPRSAARLEELEREGRRVADGRRRPQRRAGAGRGLVSLSPSSAIDISQTAADAVFQGERLAPVLELLDGRAARRAPGQAELRARLRLQRHRRAPGGARPRHAPDRRDLHVGLVAAGDRQRAAAGPRRCR